MQRIYRPLLVLGAVLALTSCGGDDSSNGSSQKPSGQASETTATTPPPTPSAQQKAPGQEKPSGAPEDSSGRPSTPSPTPDQTGGSPGRTSGQTGTNSSPSTKRSKPRAKKKESRAGLTPGERLQWKKRFYEDAKTGCRVLGSERIAREYRAESLAPRDVARAYARAFVDSFKVKPPSFTYHQTYEGCLAYLQRAAAR